MFVGIGGTEWMRIHPSASDLGQSVQFRRSNPRQWCFVSGHLGCDIF
jgi:hypothetical protein